MPGAELHSFRDLVVSLDYGQFWLHTGGEGPEAALDLLGSADGIGQQGGLVVVQSPHQNNFAMPLRVEVWTARPDDDTDVWEEVFEVHLDVGEEGLLYSSPPGDSVPLPVPQGSYHAVICGRGFVGHGWPGSTEPGDAWRIRVWPSTGPAQPSRLREYVEPTFTRPTRMFEQPGVAAAARIHVLLHDVSELSGRRGTVRVQRIMPGTRRGLFRGFRHLHGWLTSSSSHQGSTFIMGGRLDHSSFGNANQIVPSAGDIECTVISEKSPSHVHLSWSWTPRPPERRSQDQHDDRPGGPLFHQPPPMTLRFDLVNAEPDRRWPTTLITVTHDNVPAELGDDLSAYWQWALERGDYDFDLSGARMKHARQR